MGKYTETEKDFNMLGSLMKHRIQMLRMIIPDWDEQKDAREISGCLMAEAIADVFHLYRVGKMLSVRDILLVDEIVFEDKYKHLKNTPVAFASTMALALLDDRRGDGTWYGHNLLNSLVMAHPVCGDEKKEFISQKQIQVYANTQGF